MRISGIICVLMFWASLSIAQDRVVDQIVAVVGGNIILKSDVEQMHMQQQAQGVTSQGDMKCEILENLLIDKLLVAEAELDTLITVTPSQINQQMDGQIQMYVTQLGSEKAVEDYFKKPLPTIKAEMRDPIRNNLLSQQMRSKIVQDIKVTPSEVRYYFRDLSEEEIPTVPAQYEYALITLQPQVEIEEENRVKAQLREIKRRIEEGDRSFASMAVMYSEGPSASNGGVIGYKGRAELDPAYSAAAFNLKGDKISNVVKSAFGYHLIQQVDQKGEKLNTRHILMKPKISVEAREDANNGLDSLANLIRADKIPFDEAAIRFSSDKNTRKNGGVAINPNTMSSKFSLEELDPDVSKIISTMNLNEISEPFETIDPESQQMVYKVIKVTNKIESHKADLKNDYQTIANMFLAQKKEQALKDWIAERQSQTYIRIDDTYANCNFDFENWIK